jgi:hypothetical protein
MKPLVTDAIPYELQCVRSVIWLSTGDILSDETLLHEWEDATESERQAILKDAAMYSLVGRG